MARYVKGVDFKLYVLDQDEYKILACLTDCAFEVQANKIPITSRSTGLWASFDYQTLSWTATATGVFFIQGVNGGIGPFDMLNKQMGFLKANLRFRLIDREGYGRLVEGEVLVDVLNFQGAVDDAAVFDIQMTGNGPLTITAIIDNCGLIDFNEDLLIDSNGDFIIDNCALVLGEFDPAEFSEIDFIV